MGRPPSIILLEKSYEMLATRFYNYLLSLGYDASGSRSRYLYLIEFLSWRVSNGQTEVSTTTAPELQTYYAYLLNRPNRQGKGKLHPKTVCAHMRVIRKLFTMLQESGVVEKHPCSTLKFTAPQGENRRTIVSQREIKGLYAACITLQERAILGLAYGCGLRVGELVALDKNDVRLEDKMVLVKKGKGNKRRAVPMSKGTVKDLANYSWTERGQLMSGRDYKAGEQAFILHSRGGRMQKYTYNKILKRLLERGVEQGYLSKEILNRKLSIHNLRHSIATHLLEQGIRTEQVRKFLGHLHLESTQVYTHIDNDQIKKIIE